MGKAPNSTVQAPEKLQAPSAIVAGLLIEAFSKRIGHEVSLVTFNNQADPMERKTKLVIHLGDVDETSLPQKLAKIFSLPTGAQSEPLPARGTGETPGAELSSPKNLT